MNSYLRKHDPVIPDTKGPPQKRWRSHLTQWVMVGLLAVFTLGSIMPTASLAKDDGSVIKVLVLYTSYLAGKNSDYGTEASAKATIENLVTHTNGTFSRSGINDTSLELVNDSLVDSENWDNFGKVNYTKDENTSNWGRNFGNWSERLTELRAEDDNFLDDVHRWRNESMADVVILLVYASTSSLDGTAYQLKNKDDLTFESSAFAIVKASVAISELSFARQLGHIMGCTYDRSFVDRLKGMPKPIDATGISEEYSYGYILPTTGSKKICSLMAVMCNYPSDAFWSNPSINYVDDDGGHPTGTDSDNCARTLNETAETVANFRYSDPGTLQFSMPKHSVKEGSVDSATITVTRRTIPNEVLIGEVSVEVLDESSSTENPATKGSDYAVTSPDTFPTLTWTDRDDDPKVITVSIEDDENREVKETIKFALSNATGDAKLIDDTKTTTVDIKDNDGPNIAYVIDITDSMDEEIVAVQEALIKYTDEEIPEGQRVNFVTFRDKVYNWGMTDDLDKVKMWVGKLYPTGGSDCPESSVEALNVANLNVDDDGRILLVTDAAPHEDEVDNTIEMLKAKRISVDVKLTGDCDNGSAQEIFSRIASETGGSFVFMPEVNDGNTKRGDRTLTRRTTRDGSSTTLGITKLANSIFNTMVGTNKPAVIDITPTIAPQSGTLDVVINASSHTNFNDSSTVSIGGSVVVNNVKVLSATQIVANITIPSGTTPELYDVNVMTRLGTETETAEGVGLLQVLPPRGLAEVLSIAPFTIVKGTTADINISGLATSFDETSVLSLGSGITVQKLTVHSPTLMTATVDIGWDADAGLHELLVNTGSQEAKLANAFLVLSETVNSSTVSKIAVITPSRGARGTTLDVEISGQATNLSDESFLYFSGNGVTVTSFDVINATHATATINIDNNATYGFRDVIVETGDEVATMLDGLEIADLPEIQLTPRYGSQGETLDIEITGQGTNFIADESVVNIKGTDIDVLSAVVNSSTQITANVQIDSQAGAGWRSVYVTTDSEVASLHKGLEVVAAMAAPPPAAFEELMSLYKIWGRIFGENGDPIEDVTIKVGDQTTTTDDSGKWEVGGLAEGDYTVIASKKLYTFTPKNVTLSGQEFAKEVIITQGSSLVEYVVYGTIFNNDGNPIKGVIVKVGDQTTTTDDSGKWEITDLSKDDYTAVASKKLFTFTSPKVTLGDNLRTEVKIMVSPQITEYYAVHGTITDTDGNVLAGVTVQIGDKTAVTDADGKWEITDLLKGDYAIVASKEGYLSASKEVKLEENDDFKTEVTITLSKQVVVPINYTVYGTITDVDGNAVAGVTVQVGDNTAVTDADGKWEITGLSEGSYSVIASKEGITFTPQNVTLDQGPSQEVKLEPTGIYEAFGTIKDKFKVPMEGVTVEVYSKKAMSAGPVATTVTDAAGNWEITTLFEDEYTVIASKDGYLFKTRDCFASENQACEPNLSNPDSILNLTVAAQLKTVKQGENIIYVITVTNTDDGQT
ncbi:MAG: carboxypeptidase regulatory-like domain-containing protein, partial [Candidatus Parabeggiatoa sp.]|nr:carboxypeptidase regulatory-like domain-containing protein [Candidatus Parabeggiatoa sp.]